MKRLRRLLIGFGSVGLNALGAMSFLGCAEKAGSGAFMTVPNVGISCATTRCKAAVTAQAYVVYTTSSCANPSFGETAAGSATLTCSGTGCVGTATSFSTQTFREGFYSVCVIVDFNGNYVGAAIPGEDATGARENVNLVSGTALISVSSFTDI